MQVLLVEDNPADARLVQEALKDIEEVEINFECVETLSAALTRVQKDGIDLVLLDLGLPDSTGVDTVTRFCNEIPNVPVVVLTGLHDETVGVEAIKRGAQDFLTKEHVYGNLLLRSMRYAIERKRVREREEQKAQDIEYLSRTAHDFAAFPPEDDIYKYIGSRLKEIVGESVILVLSFDETSNILECHHVLGLGKFSSAVLKLIGRNPVGMQFTILEGLDAQLRQGKLLKLEKGLYELAQGQLSETASKAIEKLLGIQDIYALGIAREGRLFAHASILARKGARLENATVLEAFADQASIALQRKQAEEALRDREKKYRFLVESLNEGIWVIDAKGRTTFVNPPMAKMLGYSVEEMQGRELFSFMDEPAVELCNDYLKRRKKGIREQSEFELVRKDSSKINVIMETAPLTDEKGKYRGAISGVLDITDRKRAEESLRESELKYRDILENTSDLVQNVAPDGRILFANRGWREALGYSEEEIPGLSLFDIIHPDSMEHCMETFKRVMSGETVRDIEAAFVAKDGRQIVLEGNASCRLMEGKPLAAMCIFHDVTERKLAEERLTHLNAVLRAIRGVNQLITKEHDRNKLLKGVCENLTETRGYYNAWIALVDESGKIEVAAGAGSEERMHPRLEHLRSGKPTPCMARALNQPGVIVVEDTLSGCANCPLSHHYHGRGALTIRLEYGGKVYGVLSASIPSAFAIDKEEQSLFGEVADDISFALRAMEVEQKRKQAEEALRASEGKYRTLAKNLPQKIFLKDRNSVYVSCNENYANDLKIKPDEIAGKTDYEFYPKELAEKYRADDKRLMDSGKMEDLEEKYIIDGQKMWVHTVKTPVRDEEGNVIGILGIFWDITEHKKAEEELRASEERYRSYIEVTGQLAWTTNAIGEVEEDVPAWRAYTGQSYEEIKGWGWTKAIHPDDTERTAQVWQEVVKTRSNYETEFRVRGKDGNYRWFLSKAVPVLKEDGSIKEWVGTCIDIHERKKVQDALRENEARLRGMIQSPMIGILFWNAAGDITDANDAFLEIVGYTRDEVLSGEVRWRDMTPPEFKEQDDKMLAEIAAKGVGTPIEKEYIRKDGSRVPIFLGAASLPGPELNGVAFVLDITERKQAEEARRESEERYRDLVETTDDLVQSVSPDGSIEFVNRAWRETLGYSEEEIRGLSIFDIIHPDSRAHCMEIFQRVVAGENAENVEAKFLTKDGRTILAEGSASCRLVDGKPVATYGIFHNFTERKQAQEAIQESEENLKKAQRVAHVGSWDLDVVTGKLYWSDETYRIYGFEPQEFVPTFEKFMAILHPEDHEPVQKQVDAALSGDAEYDVDFRFVRPDGKIGWIHCDGEVTRDVEGKPLRFFGTQIDISKRKKAQEALKESEEKFRSLVENAPNIIMIVDREGVIQFINRTVPGLAVEDVIGKNHLEYVDQEYHGITKDTIEQVFKTGEPSHYEIKGVGPEDSTSWYATQVGPIRREGQIDAVMLVTTDITERKKAEEALRESEEKYRLIYATAGDAIMTLEPPEWRFTSGNYKIVEMFGVKDEEEFISLTPWQTSPEYQPDGQLSEVKAKKMIEIAMKEGENNFEWTHKRVGGKDFFATVLLNRIDVRGKVFLQARVNDITERKKAEEAARELEAQKLVVERMKELDRMKDDFISTVTHELRTPMTPLKSTIEMLLDGSLGELTDRQEKFIRMMARNVDRLAQFTTEVLTLSRLESGRFKLEPRMLALRETLEPVIELMEQKAQSKNSTVSLDIDADTSAYADADSLSIVVTNLVNNAIVHTGEDTEISVSARKFDKDLVEVSISDNGQGIPQESLDNLFDRFYQAKRKAGPGYHGTGVGLAVCKGLVEAMGGEISVESHVGEGTTFKFTLPASPPQKEDEGAKE